MGKKIGVKITVIMIIMSIMYLGSSLANGFAKEQAFGGLNRVYNNWVQLERYETRLVKAVDNCNFYANMIVHYKMPAVQEQLAQGIPVIVEGSKNAKNASGHLNQIIEKIENNEGDLTERIQVKTKDEVGQLVRGVNGFIEQLQGIMVTIRDESTHMNELVNNITTGINDSNENASSISATMEELSASMEEVAAQSTGALVEALVSIKGEADINLDISQNLQGEVSRFKTI